MERMFHQDSCYPLHCLVGGCGGSRIPCYVTCRTPFPGFPHTPFRPVDERFPLFWLAQKPPHLLRRFLSYLEGRSAYTVRERTGCIMRGKVLLLRRGTLLLILTALVAAGIFMVVGGPGFVSASAAKRQLPIYSVEREEKVCAISFDAACAGCSLRKL